MNGIAMFKSTERAVRPNHADFYFYVQPLLYTAWAPRLTRDELVYYLIHCRGYNPSHGGSLFGAFGCNRWGGLTAARYRKARQRMEALGLTYTQDLGKQRFTRVANLADPFRVDQSGEEVVPPDGHVFSDLSSEGLIGIPWSLINGCRELMKDADWATEAQVRLASIRTAEAVRVLLWCYHHASPDGHIDSRRLWEEAFEPAYDPAIPNELQMTKEQFEAAFEELTEIGLVGINLDREEASWSVYHALR